MSDTSILMSLEKNIWSEWEESPLDGSTWEAEWRDGGNPSLTVPAAKEGGARWMHVTGQVLNN